MAPGIVGHHTTPVGGEGAVAVAMQLDDGRGGGPEDDGEEEEKE